MILAALLLVTQVAVQDPRLDRLDPDCGFWLAGEPEAGLRPLPPVVVANDDCRFMTGANVLFDGGYMAY